MCSDSTKSYSHLNTRELETIQNSAVKKHLQAMEQEANMRFAEALGGDTITNMTSEEVTWITADSGSKRNQTHT